MTTYHFFIDTNFLIHHPDINNYLFDSRPYAFVICRAVMRELNGLKNWDGSSTEEEKSRSFRARQASRTIDAIQDGKIQLPNAGQLVIYAGVRASPGTTFDEQIEATVKRYAAERKSNEAVVFLTGDRNLRILSRSDRTLIVVDPDEWQADRRKLQEYELKLEGAAKNDDQLMLLHKRRLGLEKKLERAQDEGDKLAIQKLQTRLAGAREQENTQFVQFDNERQVRAEKAREKSAKEEARRIEEKRKIELAKAREIESANRNKYSVSLADIGRRGATRRFPVKMEDRSQVGEIVVQSYCGPAEFTDRITTIRLSARIAGQVFPLVLISSSERQPYPLEGSAYLFDPTKHSQAQLEQGTWRIKLRVEEVTMVAPPIFLPDGTRWDYPVFKSLVMSIEAVELTAEEKQAIAAAKAEAKGTSKLGGRLNTVLWILAGVAVVCGPCLLCLGLWSVGQLPSTTFGSNSFENGEAHLSVSPTDDALVLEVCRDHLAGNRVNVIVSDGDTSWEYSQVAVSDCITFEDMTGDVPLISGTTYSIRAAINQRPDPAWPIPCWEETDNQGLCTSIEVR